MRYSYILFDLDGTLTDPKLGITKSVAYALDKMGIVNVDLESLRRFIGPPLQDSFMEYYGFSEEKSKKAVEYFREYFRENGIFENEIYDGIKKLLEDLKNRGLTLAVATSKPQVFAEKVLEYFEIKQYFTSIVGSELNGNRSKKAEVIQCVLDELRIINKEEAIMIGDREHDIIGANTMGIDSIGVRFGYAEGDELERAGATYIVKTVSDLNKLLII